MKKTISIITTMIIAAAMMLGSMTVVFADDTASGAEYSLDLEGMISWMSDTKNLTDQQKYDLQRATTIIDDAKEESFSKWYGGDKVNLSDDRNDKITDLSDENDAVNLRQMPIAIQNMKRINELRQEDDNYANLGMKDSYTNFYLMSVATTGAMRGAGLKRHSSLKVSCECLSWGTTNGADNWYYGEKKLFNNIKDTLGITTITSRDQITQIEDYADDNNITIGHYTALFWSEDQVMGVGYTPYSKTACYNASKSSNYSAFKLYTVDEFEALVKEFCAYVGTHDLGSETITRTATCTADGAASYVCNICGAKVNKAIPATGHSWNEDYTVDKEATCTASGLKSIHCANCSETKGVITVPATGHSYGDWTITEEATCTEAGSKEKVCISCGDTITETINANGHSWDPDYTVDKEATCTEEGSKSIHCVNCDEAKDAKAIPAKGHSFGDWTVVTSSTCTDSGVRQRVCSDCGLTETDSIDPSGHDFEDDFTVDAAATCTADGSQSRHCRNCDAVIDSETIPATGHSYGNWVTTKDPTCTAEGVRTRTCKNCGDKISGTIAAKGHSWNSEPTVDKAATCTKDGSQSVHCARCSETKDTEVIPAAGHTWNKEYTVDKKATQTSAGSKSIHCSVCNTIKEGSSVTIAKLAPSEKVDLPAVTISKPKAAKKAMTVKWKKVSKKNQKKIGSIQIQYSTDKTFKKGVKTVTAKKSAASKKIKKLTSKKKYYVRVRAYKKTGNTIHVSKWSKVKAIKVK